MKLWYILPAILVFGILILIHELGHFLCARAAGVEIKEFAIGMGPRLFGWTSKKYGTKYAVRLFPIGGYVSMLGEDEESDSENSFGKKNVWARIAIVIAGPLMNLLLGFLAMLIMVSTSGQLASNVIYYENGTGQVSGLQDGDRIVKVDGTAVHTGDEVNYEISWKGIEPMDLTIERDGKKIELENVLFPTNKDEASGVIFGYYDFKFYAEKGGVGTVLKHTFFRSTSMVKMVIDSFVGLFNGRVGLQSVSGPVGITEGIGASISMGLQSFLFLFSLITINLGVFNLFPIPALDGGRLIFLLIEAIIGRPVNPKIEGYIHAAGMLLMLGLVLIVTFKDIIGLF